MVLDASAAFDLLVRREPAASWVAERALEARVLRAPHLIETEVVSALRRRLLRGELVPEQAERAISNFVAIPITKYPTTWLLPRMLELGRNLTAYDAAYVALAEALDARLLTADVRLSRAAGGLVPVTAVG